MRYERGETIVRELVDEYAAQLGEPQGTVKVISAEHEAVAAYRAGATVVDAALVGRRFLLPRGRRGPVMPGSF